MEALFLAEILNLAQWWQLAVEVEVLVTVTVEVLEVEAGAVLLEIRAPQGLGQEDKGMLEE